MNTYIEEMINNSANKRITYAEFIRVALYHPEQGYYMKNDIKIGRSGDFITTSNVSHIYGKIIAKWYAENHLKYHLPAAVCEIGGGTGRFAKAFLEGWEQYSSVPLTYFLVESSPYHQQLQAETLVGFNNFTQYQNISQLRNFTGLVFSNELFDALPVHVIEKKGGELYEVMITSIEYGLKEVLVPLENMEILRFIDQHGVSLNEEQRIEIPLEMEEMVKSISERLTCGIVISVDYGYTKEEWQQPERKNGSLRGYYRQQMYGDVLQFPGMMDITSHVHFDALIRSGEENGLRFKAKQRQDEFLLSAGILDELAESYDPNPFSEQSKLNRAIKSLILPGGMSSAFHVIIQEKGCDSSKRE
ncbi:MAG: class I SAM-dependent methyltransferase [Bacillota bacterium]